MFDIEYLKREIAAQQKRVNAASVFTAAAHQRKLRALRQALAIASAEADASRIELEIIAAANL